MEIPETGNGRKMRNHVLVVRESPIHGNHGIHISGVDGVTYPGLAEIVYFGWEPGAQEFHRHDLRHRSAIRVSRDNNTENRVGEFQILYCIDRQIADGQSGTVKPIMNGTRGTIGKRGIWNLFDFEVVHPVQQRQRTTESNYYLFSLGGNTDKSL